MGSKFSKRKKKNQTLNDYPIAYNGPPIPDLADSRRNDNRERNDEWKAVPYLDNVNLYQSPQNSNYSRYKYNLRQLAEIIMFGFVRAHCLIALDKTPQDIIDLCLLFYSVGDEWDTTTSDSRLVHNEGQIVISKPEDCLTISRYYAFGKDTCNRGQRYLWRFEVTCRDERYTRISLSIGIIERRFINERSFDVANNNDYLYDNNRYKLMLRNGNVSDGDTVKHYCGIINVGDVIEMELDLTSGIYGKLSYLINNIPCGVAFDQIPTKRKYALCVAFQRRDKLRIIPHYEDRRDKLI